MCQDQRLQYIECWLTLSRPKNLALKNSRVWLSNHQILTLQRMNTEVFLQDYLELVDKSVEYNKMLAQKTKEVRKIAGKLHQYQKMLHKKRDYAIKQSRVMELKDALTFLHPFLKSEHNKSFAESIQFTRRVRHEINTRKKMKS